MENNDKFDMDEIFLELGKLLFLIDPSFKLDNKLVTFKNIKEILDQLRVRIKYDKLDIEAQRREIRYLISLVDSFRKN